MWDTAQRRRAYQLAKLDVWLTARTAFVQTAKRAKPAAGLRTRRAGVKRHQLEPFVQVSRHEGQLTATLVPTAQAEATQLEGCDVLETDGPQPALDAQAVHDRYGDFYEVEQDFRSMQTGLLEVRPIFGRQARRTRAQVCVTM